MADTLTKEQREKVRILSNIQKHLKDKKWGCIIEGCNEPAINSHLLQQHGVLSEICNGENHFYEIRVTDANTWRDSDPPIQFKLVGIKDAISLNLFCSKHDTDLFAEIEQQPIDFTNYRHLLLFCKRTAFSEIRKKEIANEMFRRMCNARILSLSTTKISELKKRIRLNELGISDTYKDLSTIEEELNHLTGRFQIVHRAFSRQDIYATAIVSYDQNINDAFSQDEKLDSFYFNVIPYEGQLHIILCYDSKDTNKDIIDYGELWRNCKEEQLGQLLTGIFAAKIENWGMSVELFQKLSEEKKEIYISLFDELMEAYPEPLVTDFNLFEGIF